MSAHTPGPWTVNVFKFESEIAGPNGEDIGYVNHNDGGDEPVLYPMKANARLIAAAPELLVALTELLTLYLQFEDANFDTAKAIFDNARAAIAKAAGQ